MNERMEATLASVEQVCAIANGGRGPADQMLYDHGVRMDVDAFLKVLAEYGVQPDDAVLAGMLTAWLTAANLTRGAQMAGDRSSAVHSLGFQSSFGACIVELARRLKK